MDYIVLSPQKNEEWFKKTKAAVFRGEISHDDFDTEDYKYFDKLHKLSISYHAGQINKDQFNSADKKNYAEYEKFKQKTNDHIEKSKMICSNIRRSEILRIEISKTDDPKKALETALEIIEMLTGETGFKNRIMKGLTE